MIEVKLVPAPHIVHFPPSRFQTVSFTDEGSSAAIEYCHAAERRRSSKDAAFG
jgi:hypothetical protein